MVVDPRVTLATSPMRSRQIVAIALCVALNAIDGFDVLSISFASPGIAKEWGIDRAALGLVLSMELIGMAVGSLILGQVADRVGRRPTTLACLVAMVAGMFATSQVSAISELVLTRLVTGFGIGGMLVCTNAMVAEYSNEKWRGASVAIMAAGYPVGAILGGSVATRLLATGNWRDVFTFGAVISAAFIPLVAWLVPESVGYLLQKRPHGVLDRLNRALRGIGHDPVAQVPQIEPGAPKSSPAELFAPRLRSITVLLTLAYFLHIMTFYFILKWVPKIVVDMGFSPSLAGGVLVWANIGGLLGSLLLSFLSLRYVLRTLVIVALVASSVMVTVFGQGQANLTELAWAAAAGGFCTNAGVVGFYALIAASFPTAVRGGGTGFVIGVGRGGAAMGPIIAGLLFQIGLGLPMVAAVMASGSILAALALYLMPRDNAPQSAQ